MVEADIRGDGAAHAFKYAVFRKDKAPTPGYSPELIYTQVDP